MATITSLNQYKAAYPDSTDLTVVAETMADAIVALAGAKQGEPSLIQKIVTGIATAIPDPAISIVTTVTGEGATTAGCKATPYTIDAVKNGEKAWFTAIPAEGFVFAGWYLNNELLSNDESYEATIEYNGTSPVTLNYEARFTVA